MRFLAFETTASDATCRPTSYVRDDLPGLVGAVEGDFERMSAATLMLAEGRGFVNHPGRWQIHVHVAARPQGIWRRGRPGSPGLRARGGCQVDRASDLPELENQTY